MPLPFRHGGGKPLAWCVVVIALALCGCKPKDADKPAPKTAHVPRAQVHWDQLDPIQRCIYQGSPPESQWSFPVVQALCEDGFWPVVGAADLKRMIDEKDWKALDALYAGYLQRHLKHEEPEYLIYRALQPVGWKSRAEAERYTRRWMAARPNDPFARTVRAAQLLTLAREARGDGHRDQVPKSHLAKVKQHSRQANTLLRRVVAGKPDLAPAYALLIESYALGGDASAVDLALGTALKQVPWSYYIPARALDYVNESRGTANQRLQTVLTHSRAYSRENPRLALLPAYEKFLEGDRLYNFSSYKRAIRVLGEATSTAPLEIGLMRSARCSTRLGHHLNAMAYYDQIVRFGMEPGEALVGRGIAWEHVGDPRKALSDYKSAQLYLPDRQELLARIALLEKSLKQEKAGS